VVFVRAMKLIKAHITQRMEDGFSPARGRRASISAKGLVRPTEFESVLGSTVAFAHAHGLPKRSVAFGHHNIWASI
jgi:hypothetical protein